MPSHTTDILAVRVREDSLDMSWTERDTNIL